MGSKASLTRKYLPPEMWHRASTPRMPSRGFRRGMPIEKALAIIAENIGVQFDRAFGERFVAQSKAGALYRIVGHSNEGIPLHECMMCDPTLSELVE